jgi:hypothetical protein
MKIRTTLKAGPFSPPCPKCLEDHPTNDAAPAGSIAGKYPTFDTPKGLTG